MIKIINTNQFQLLKWFWKDAILRYKNKVTLSLFYNFLYILFQYSSYGLLFFYLDLVEQKQKVAFYDFYIDLRWSAKLFLAVSMVIGLFFLLTGIFEFLSKRIMIKLAEKHEKFCEHRLLLKISKLKHPEQILDYPILDFKNLQKSGFKDCIKIGQLLRTLNPFVTSILNFILSFGFLLYLSPLFSIIFFVLLPLAFILIRKNSSKIVDNTILFEGNRSDFIRRKKESLIKALKREENSYSISESGLKQRDQEFLMREYFKSFYGRFLTQAETLLITKILISICVFGTLVFAGYMIFYVGNLRWSFLIGFIVALRIFLNSLSSLSSIANKLSKNYNYVSNYRLIMLKLNEIANSIYKPNTQQKFAFKNMVSELKDDDDDDDD